MSPSTDSRPAAPRATARGALRRLVPAPARQWLRTLVQLAPSARPAFVRLTAARLVGRRRATVPAVAGRPLRVVFICHGNIIRSAMGAALLRAARDAHGIDVEIRSAGTAAVADAPADPRAVAVAPEFGVRLDEHRAQPLDADLVAWADLLLVMDWRNEVEVLVRHPHARGKVVLLGAFAAPDRRARAIHDPFTGGTADVRACYRELAPAVRQLAAELPLHRPAPTPVTLSVP